MMPSPTAMTRPMTTQTGDTCRRTPPYQRAARAPISRMKYPTRYMLMNRMDTLSGDGKTPGVFPSSVVLAQTLALQRDSQRGAAVETARLFPGVVVLRPLFTVADGAEAIRTDAAADEIVAHRTGAALAEREVVLGRA